MNVQVTAGCRYVVVVVGSFLWFSAALVVVGVANVQLFTNLSFPRDSQFDQFSYLE